MNAAAAAAAAAAATNTVLRVQRSAIAAAAGNCVIVEPLTAATATGERAARFGARFRSVQGLAAASSLLLLLDFGGCR